MKTLTLVMLFAVGWGCNPLKEKTEDQGSYSYNSSLPLRWKKSILPLDFRIASDFTSIEGTEIITMANEWNNASYSTTFFIDTYSTTNSKSVDDPDSFLDSVMGVYKSTNWHSSLPTDALAVTQIFGVQKTDDQGPHIELQHADIIINEEHFDFSTDDTYNTYDLGTVVIHEVGHFLGLGHNSDSSVNTVMYPSVSMGTVYNFPFNSDIDSLEKLYPSSTTVALTSDSSYSLVAPIEEKPVRLVFELKTNGKCKHYINGEHVHTHQGIEHK